LQNLTRSVKMAQLHGLTEAQPSTRFEVAQLGFYAGGDSEFHMPNAILLGLTLLVGVAIMT